MNLKSVNTVSDLIAANDTNSPEESVLSMIDDVVANDSPAAALRIASQIISKLIATHEVISEKMIENGKGVDALIWAEDSGKLQVAKGIIDSIDL